MNTPNKLTVLRIVMVPFFVTALLLQIPHHYLIAGLLFGTASYTDHLDGMLARKNGQITDFGKFADPLADKILVMSAFICFVQLGLTGAVVVLIILARELMVTSMRLAAAGSGKVVAANIWGKAKTVSQIVSILVVIVLQYVQELISMHVLPGNLFGTVDRVFLFNIIGNASIWIAAVFTLISGVIYMWENREFIKNAK